MCRVKSLFQKCLLLSWLVLPVACTQKTSVGHDEPLCPPLTGQQVFEKAQPFLNCAYVRFVESMKKNKVYSDEQADEACKSCSSLLEIYKDTLYDRIRDERFVNEEAASVVGYAKKVMKSASQ